MIKKIKNYNKLISIKNIKCEKLFRNDNKYNFFIPINYNIKKERLEKEAQSLFT